MAEPTASDCLARAGVVVESAPGRCRIRLDRRGCRPCDGRCAAGFRRAPAELHLDRELPQGARVELTASALRMTLASIAAFGLPLAALVGSLLVVVATGVAEAWALAGFGAGALLAFALLKQRGPSGGLEVREL